MAEAIVILTVAICLVVLVWLALMARRLRTLADALDRVQGRFDDRAEPVEAEPPRSDSSGSPLPEVVAMDESLAETNAQADIHRAGLDSEVAAAHAQADQAYDLHHRKVRQDVKRAEVGIDRVEEEERTKVAEHHVERRSLELTAEVRLPADAERYRDVTRAEGDKESQELRADGAAYASRAIASGEADAVRAKGEAESDTHRGIGHARAEAIRSQGLAEAEVIEEKGYAEARAHLARGSVEAHVIGMKADALTRYGQAAVFAYLAERLPQIASEIGESEALKALAEAAPKAIESPADAEAAVARLAKSITESVPLPVLEPARVVSQIALIAQSPPSDGTTEAASAESPQ